VLRFPKHDTEGHLGVTWTGKACLWATVQIYFSTCYLFITCRIVNCCEILWDDDLCHSPSALAACLTRAGVTKDVLLSGDTIPLSTLCPWLLHHLPVSSINEACSMWSGIKGSDRAGKPNITHPPLIFC